MTVEPFLQPLHNYVWNPILFLESVIQSVSCSIKTQVTELVERCRLAQSCKEHKGGTVEQWAGSWYARSLPSRCVLFPLLWRKCSRTSNSCRQTTESQERGSLRRRRETGQQARGLSRDIPVTPTHVPPSFCRLTNVLSNVPSTRNSSNLTVN